MKALVAALNRIATALEQLVPALTQATREARYTKGRHPAHLSYTGWIDWQASGEYDEWEAQRQRPFGHGGETDE